MSLNKEAKPNQMEERKVFEVVKHTESVTDFFFFFGGGASKICQVPMKLSSLISRLYK